MELFAQTQQKSRLGQILLDKRLVSQEQLSKAMEQQATTGERLGDILTQWNVVTQRHIESALRAQRNLRLVASLVTAMATPFITACGGGGGETSPTTQSSAAQSTATAIAAAAAAAAAAQGATESSAPNTAPTVTGWVIRDSVCCALGATTTTGVTATDTASTPTIAPTSTTTPTTQTATASTLPLAPSNLAAYAANTNRVVLSWDEIQSDTPGSTTYRVYRNGSAVAMTELTGNTFFDTTAAPNTTYTYQIRTVDLANNMSGLSVVAMVTTPST